VTDEDVPLIGIPFTVWDAETPPEQLTFSTMLELPDGSFSRDSMRISGSGTNRELSIFPPPDISGTALAFLTVRDSGGLSSAVKFNVMLRPVNDPPRISAIADRAVLRGQGLVQAPFSLTDVDTNARLVGIRAWSSRQSVVKDTALRIVPSSGSGDHIPRTTLGLEGIAGSTA